MRGSNEGDGDGNIDNVGDGDGNVDNMVMTMATRLVGNEMGKGKRGKGML